MPKNNVPGTSAEEVQVYEATAPLLTAMQIELKGFAKKKPDATLSKTKVTFVNRLLRDLKELLQNEPNSKYLDLLDDETLPQYSDAVLVVSQYEAALKAFHNRHTEGEFGEREWVYLPRKKQA